MDAHDWAALHYLETASDEDWMCVARYYLESYHPRLALWMVNQRRCPAAVALALYWYSYPATCLDYCRKRNISYYHSEKFAVFETVEHRYTAGFYTDSDIGFDPKNDISDPVGSLKFGRNWTDSMSDEDRLENKCMTLAVPGKIVDVQKITADWREGLPPRLASLFSYSSP